VWWWSVKTPSLIFIISVNHIASAWLNTDLIGVIFLKNPKQKNTDKKPYVRPRNINLSMKITQDERDMIEQRMAQAGMKAIRAYIVKMAIDGRVIYVELDSVREMVRLLSNATNNINQIARKTNETGSIYSQDVEMLKEEVENIWGQTQVILQKINKL